MAIKTCMSVYVSNYFILLPLRVLIISTIIIKIKLNLSDCLFSRRYGVSRSENEEKVRTVVLTMVSSFCSSQKIVCVCVQYVNVCVCVHVYVVVCVCVFM